MKIMLNGATSGTNFGDCLMAKMFQDAVCDMVAPEDVYWYDSRFAYSDFFKNYLGRQGKHDLRGVHGLVYISGGYFCGQDRTWKDYVRRYLAYFSVGMACARRRVPYAVIGVEVGKSRSSWMERVQTFILKYASVVAVRNGASADHVKSMGISSVICTQDILLAMPESMYMTAELTDGLASCDKPTLLFHIQPTLEKNQVIIEKVVPVVNEFLSRHPQYRVVLATDQCVPEQTNALTAVSGLIRGAEVVMCPYHDPLTLCRVIAASHVVVTTKLHVGVVGAKMGKSVISFAGHAQKIQRFYEQLGEAERSCPLATLTQAQGAEMLETYAQKPIHVPEDMVQSATKNLEILRQFLWSLCQRDQV